MPEPTHPTDRLRIVVHFYVDGEARQAISHQIGGSGVASPDEVLRYASSVIESKIDDAVFEWRKFNARQAKLAAEGPSDPWNRPPNRD